MSDYIVKRLDINNLELILIYKIDTKNDELIQFKASAELGRIEGFVSQSSLHGRKGNRTSYGQNGPTTSNVAKHYKNHLWTALNLYVKTKLNWLSFKNGKQTTSLNRNEFDQNETFRFNQTIF